MGKPHLLVEPNPELLKLENPYDYHQRRDLEYLWDTTLYNGKYYLYWGPVPAVLGVIVSSITSKPVTDTGLVFFFVIGIALFSILLLRDIYKEYQVSCLGILGRRIRCRSEYPTDMDVDSPKIL